MCSLFISTEDLTLQEGEQTTPKSYEDLSRRDVRSLVSRRSFFRYRRALLEYGLDIYDERPARITAKIREEVVLVPVSAPDWYWKEAA